MPLKVTWVGNEAGAAIPLAVLDPTAVTVMVLDETGAPSPAAHELVAKLRHGGQTDLVDFADVVVAAGNAKQGTLHLPPRWSWHLPRLELTASRLDGTGEPVRREVLVVTGPMLWPARIAMFLGGVGLLYTLAIFPQLKALPTLICRGRGRARSPSSWWPPGRSASACWATSRTRSSAAPQPCSLSGSRSPSP